MILSVILTVAAAEQASIVNGPSGHVTLTAQEVEFVVGNGTARKALTVSEIISEARARRRSLDDIGSSIEDVESAIVYHAKHSECEFEGSEGASDGSTSSDSATGAIEQASFTPSGEIAPTVMLDGEMLYARGRGLVPGSKEHPLAYTVGQN
jgi:hypothetical protein